MKTVRVDIANSTKALDLVKDVINSGMKLHQDFEFRYNTARYDMKTGEMLNRHVAFDFPDERNALIFILKWT